MKRRGGRAGPISLFAFQDIIASVIGMVFVVVLVMALDIVNTKAAGEAVRLASVTENDLQLLRGKARDLETQIRAVQSDIARLAESLELASGDEEVALDEVKRLEATLKSLYTRIRGDQETTEQADAERHRFTEDHSRRLEEAERLDRRVADLRERIRTAEARPRLAFIIDPHPDRLEPWLVEVSALRLCVASKDGKSAMLEFGGASPDQMKDRFLAWTTGQDNRTHYFVLLIKPSGIKLSDELGRALKARGFEIGKDLLPEEWEPF